MWITAATSNLPLPCETSRRGNDCINLPSTGYRCGTDEIIGMRDLSPPHWPTTGASILQVTSNHAKPQLAAAPCNECSQRRCTSAPFVGVSSKHQRVNLCYCAFDPDGMLKRHKVYTCSGRMSLRPVRGCCSCY